MGIHNRQQPMEYSKKNSYNMSVQMYKNRVLYRFIVDFCLSKTGRFRRSVSIENVMTRVVVVNAYCEM